MRFNLSTKLFDYILVFYAICVSGNPFFIYKDSVNNYNIFLLLVGIKIIIRLLKREINIFNFRKSTISFFVIVLLLLMVSMLLNQDQKYLSYINIFIRLIGAYLFALAIDLKSFSNVFVRIMVFLSVTSIILYGIYQISPQIANAFGELPNSTLEAVELNRIYVNALYLYTFMVNFGFGTSDIWSFSRNNGVFWEPGAFQFFLNLALVLLMEKFYDDKHKRMFFIILMITVLSTGSSTGLISLLAICLVYRNELGVYFKQYLIRYNLIFIILAAFIVGGIVKYSDYFLVAVNKFLGELGRPDYLVERIGLAYVSELFNGIHLLFGFGITKLRTMEAAATLNNTYAYYLFAFGIFYTITILYSYFNNYKRNFKHYLGAYIVLILGLSSEIFILYPVALGMLFFMDEKVKVTRKLDVKH